eukprot:3257797-Pyramimonas_sp.AAC.1
MLSKGATGRLCASVGWTSEAVFLGTPGAVPQSEHSAMIGGRSRIRTVHWHYESILHVHQAVLHVESSQ